MRIMRRPIRTAEMTHRTMTATRERMVVVPAEQSCEQESVTRFYPSRFHCGIGPSSIGVHVTCFRERTVRNGTEAVPYIRTGAPCRGGWRGGRGAPAQRPVKLRPRGTQVQAESVPFDGGYGFPWATSFLWISQASLPRLLTARTPSVMGIIRRTQTRPRLATGV